MGFYLQTKHNTNKADQLIVELDAVEVKPTTFDAIPKDKFLIAVISNMMFDAALVVYSQNEFNVATDPRDRRPVRYLLIDKDVVYNQMGMEANDLKRLISVE